MPLSAQVTNNIIANIYLACCFFFSSLHKCLFIKW